MADNNLNEDVIDIAFDGLVTVNKNIWGEFFVGNYSGLQNCPFRLY